MVSSSKSACLGGVLGGDDEVETRGTSSKGLPWPANLIGRAVFLELLFLNLFLILRHQPILPNDGSGHKLEKARRKR